MKSKKLIKKIRGVWKRKTTRKTLIGGGLVIVAVAVAFFSFSLVNSGKVLPHTYLGGVNFGGMTKFQAQSALSGLIAQHEGNQLNYNYAKKTYSAKLNDLEINYQNLNDTTISQLMSVGRTGALGKIIKETVRSIFIRNSVSASFSISQIKLNEYLTNIAKDVDKNEKDATLEIQGDVPVVLKEEIGQKFDLDENNKIALTQIGNFDLERDLPFTITKIQPKIDTPTAAAAIPATLELMQRHLVLKAVNKTFKLETQDVQEMIEFVAILNKNSVFSTPQSQLGYYRLTPEISTAKLDARVEKIAQEVYQEPKDPKFKVSSDKVVAFQLAQTGYELDKKKATSQIIEALKTDVGTLDLPVKVTESSLSSDDPQKLGLKDLISEGKTSWRGSPANRIHNLTLGSSNISGTIVKPGEEFSTVKAIGDISAAAGFLPELVIKNSTQVTPEIGGGLCQVSTTLFRAVLNAGLKITARTAHSFRVSYYEPPVGMDATIYDPAPDLKFVNNMDTPVFIWAVPGNNILDFQIYGTKDGRKIEISDPVVYDYTSVGAPIYTESASMAPGEIRQVERATSGASASFTYKVTSAAGDVLQSETYVSKYVPIPDSFLYGPGTEGIPTPPAE